MNSAYMNVSISSVCSDGTIYCQLPSRGLAKLTELLEKIETYFHSQVDNTAISAHITFHLFVILLESTQSTLICTLLNDRLRFLKALCACDQLE